MSVYDSTAMRMAPATGDIIALRYSDPDIYMRAIEWATKGITHHDELIVETCGLLFCADAKSPHMELIPLSDRLDQVASGKIKIAIMRPSAVMKMQQDEYNLWQARVYGATLAMADMDVPYDWPSIFSQGWNAIASALPYKLGDRLKNSEHKIYCTESVDLAWTIGGKNPLREKLTPQKFLAPVHVERLWKSADLIVIRDYGLETLLASRWGDKVISS